MRDLFYLAFFSKPGSSVPPGENVFKSAWKAPVASALYLQGYFPVAGISDLNQCCPSLLAEKRKEPLQVVQRREDGFCAAAFLLSLLNV